MTNRQRRGVSTEPQKPGISADAVNRCVIMYLMGNFMNSNSVAHSVRD